MKDDEMGKTATIITIPILFFRFAFVDLRWRSSKKFPTAGSNVEPYLLAAKIPGDDLFPNSRSRLNI